MKRKGAGRSTACRLREQERKIHELERMVQLVEEARCHYVDQYDFAVFGCITLDEKGCILELNITAADLLGCGRAGLMGLPLFSFIAKSHLTAFFNHLRQCRHSQEKIVTEVVIGKRGKPQTIVELCSVPVLDAQSERTVYRTALLDITERRLADQKLRQSEEDLKRLQREVLEISEREQARIGRDLHDGACQDLSCIALLAEVAARELAREKSGTVDKVRDISELARQTLNDVRSLATGLVPVKIEQYGLEGALQELAITTSALNNIRCSFIMRKPVTISDQNAAANLYRIAQEAVSNAVRHGRAANILIELAEPDGTVSLIIQDDGTGLPRRSKKSGLGLHTMQYRAKILGGSFKVGPTAMRGTVVTCSFPRENFALSEAKACLSRE